MKLVVAMTDHKCGFKHFEGLKLYGIIDFKTGKLLERKLGSILLVETKRLHDKHSCSKINMLEDTNPYANAFVSHSDTRFYNLATVNKGSKFPIYRYVYIDSRNLKIVASNFDDIIISIFKCGDKHYFRVDCWIWEIKSNNTHRDIDHASTLFVGDCNLDWSNSFREYDEYMMFIIESINYDKANDRLYFNFTSACYTPETDINEEFVVRTHINNVKINLNTGEMVAFMGCRGIHIDDFNRNLIFGR